MIYGIALFIPGLILFTIGGFIAMVRNPKLHNDEARSNFDPVRKDIPTDAGTAFSRAIMHDPKAKWFSRIGLALGVAGMALTFVSPERAANSNKVDNVGTTKLTSH